MKFCCLCNLDCSDFSNEALLRSFKLCKRHTKELEAKVMECPRCQNQDLEFKEGKAKATGKPWRAYKCQPCGLMIGMNGIPWGEKPKAPPQASNASKRLFPTSPQTSSSIEAKLDEILAILRKDEAPF